MGYLRWILCLAFFAVTFAEMEGDPTKAPAKGGVSDDDMGKGMENEEADKDKKDHKGCKDRCGTYDKLRDCSCSHHCKMFKKCCSDFKEHCMCAGVKCKAKYSMCKDGKCMCMEGYSRHSDGTCRAKMTMAKDKCDGVKCKDKHSMCKDGKCQCMIGYSRHSDGTCKASECKNRCGTYDRRRDCSCSHHCLKAGKCCSDFKKHCGSRLPPTKTPKPDKCKDVKCKEHAKCMDGKCHCSPNYEMKDDGSCKAKMTMAKDKCAEVKCEEEHSMCKDGKCQCKEGYSRHSDGTCKSKMSMTKDKCAGVKCKTKYSMCKDGKCECMKGYSRHSDGSCVSGCKNRCGTYDRRRDCSCSHHCLAAKKCCSDFKQHCGSRVPPTKAPKPDKCKDVKCKEHAKCMDGKCHCSPNYDMQDDGSCKAKMPMTKDKCEGVICKMNYTMCKDGECVCMKGYMRHKDGTCKAHQGCKNRCGTYDKDRDCSCSHHCWKADKCCSDFKEHCEQFFHLFRRPE